MSFLILACLGLLVGPALSFAGSKLGRVHSLVDGFSLALVGGLCVAVALPDAVAELGFTGLGLAAAGLAVPWLSHRFRPEGPWSLGIVAMALAAHVVLDGAILAVGEADEPLTWAVIAHRLPVGFALVIVGGSFSRNPAQVVWGLAGMMVSATVTGFLGGAALLGALPPVAVTGMEAFVAGVLLHIVVTPHDHGHHDHAEVAHQRDGHGHAEVDVHGHTHGQACDHDHEDHHGHSHGSHDHGHHHGHTHGSAHQGNAWGATGAVAGLGALIVAAMLMPHGHHGEALDFVPTLTVLVLESAPALLLGYGLAGIAPSLLTPSTLGALARGGRGKQALRGVAFGLPLPVCSCGVLPLYESLVRRGAPPVAAIAFFVATPELGLDAVLLSVPLLGSSLTLARVVAALVVALIVALIVGSGISAQSPIGEESSHGDETRPLSVRIREGMRFGFVEVFDHTMPWIVLGLLIAAFAEPLLSEDAISAVPTALQVPVAALVGIPLYVCASGATPVAALALHKGLSAGAAISFLIAGPATNVTTFGVLAKLHGRRMAMLFGVSVTVLAVLAGWTVDILGVPAAPVLDAHAVPDAHGGPVAWVCVVALSALCLSSLYRQGPRGALRQILEPIHMH